MTKAIKVLQLLADCPRSIGPREIAQRLDISKSTVHRLLKTLEADEMVVQDRETRRYRLGQRTLQLGASYLEQLDVLERAYPYLIELRNASLETASLNIRIGDERIYVQQVESRFELKAKNELGKPYPLYSGAPGLALLSFLPDDEIDAILGRIEFTRFTASTPSNREQVWEAIRKNRRQGYVLAHEETIIGTNTIAAPVRDHLGRVIAALNISGPTTRFGDEKMKEFMPLLMRKANELSTEMGYRGAPEKVRTKS